MADKEHKDVDEVLEEFAAKIANKEDNPVVDETKPKNRLRLNWKRNLLPIYKNFLDEEVLV